MIAVARNSRDTSEASNSPPGLRHIGEVMPAVLARYGLRSEPLDRRANADAAVSQVIAIRTPVRAGGELVAVG